jgi:hypothetical protein
MRSAKHVERRGFRRWNRSGPRALPCQGRPCAQALKMRPSASGFGPHPTSAGTQTTLGPSGRRITTETTRLRTANFLRRIWSVLPSHSLPNWTSRDLANAVTPDGTRWHARKLHKIEGSSHSEAVTTSLVRNVVESSGHEANEKRINSCLGPPPSVPEPYLLQARSPKYLFCFSLLLKRRQFWPEMVDFEHKNAPNGQAGDNFTGIGVAIMRRLVLQPRHVRLSSG